MMHVFPRTFTPAIGRADRRPDAAIAVAPLSPAAYLRLCREAAYLSPRVVAALVAPKASGIDQAVELLALLETPGTVAKRAETLERLRIAFPFDPDVYRQLATEPPERHPRVCRGCAASTWSPGDGVLRWHSDHCCVVCAGLAPDGDDA